jgi:hypothetical protein
MVEEKPGPKEMWIIDGFPVCGLPRGSEAREVHVTPAEYLGIQDSFHSEKGEKGALSRVCLKDEKGVQRVICMASSLDECCFMKFEHIIDLTIDQ